MLVKIISVPFETVSGGFNDSALRDFMKDKEVISVEEHFFVRNEVPYLTFIVKYSLSTPYSVAQVDVKAQKEKDWRQNLTEADMGLFNLLRDWRSTRSKKDGLPVYLLFTNEQLSKIVNQRPQSVAELTSISGIGQAKSEKYGREVLEITKIRPPAIQMTIPKSSGVEISPGATV